MSGPVRVGINGFGRIGRNFYRAVLAQHPGQIEIVAANSLGDIKQMAHLLKYDTLLGTLPGVAATADGIRIGDHHLKITAERDPAKLQWADLGVDVVIESTGHFTKAADASKHLVGGAKKVIISAPRHG